MPAYEIFCYDKLCRKNESYYRTLGRYLKDTGLSDMEKHIDALLKRRGIKNPDRYKERLYLFIKEYLTRVFRDIAVRQYLYMEKTGDYGSMDKDYISVSFCRALLNIPSSRSLYQTDVDKFYQKIAFFDKKMGNKSAVEYIKENREGSFSFLGIPIAYHSLSILEKYLQHLNAPFLLYYSYGKEFMSIIWGEGRIEARGNYFIRHFEVEFIRTPNKFISQVASNERDNYMLIRNACCEIIFQNKWQGFFEKSKLEIKKDLQHPTTAVREGIRAKALALYHAESYDEIMAIKSEFINDMIDGIFWHEVGHKIARSKDEARLKSWGDVFLNDGNVLHVLGEILADWAPHEGQAMGSMARFVQIAKEDPDKATRLVYVYLSDNWFLEIEEDSMSLMNDIMNALVLGFIKPNAEIDFSRMEQSISTIFNYAQEFNHRTLRESLDLIESGCFLVAHKTLNYAQLNEAMFCLSQPDYAGIDKTVAAQLIEAQNAIIFKPQHTIDSLEKMYENSRYWHNLWGYVKAFSPSSFQAVNGYFEKNSELLRQGILELLKEISVPDAFAGIDARLSLRELLFAKYRQIGILQEPLQLNVPQTVLTVCKSLQLGADQAVVVIQRFLTLMNNKEYLAIINYKGNADPFIAVLQYMMKISNYGSINSAVSKGKYCYADDPVERKKEYLIKELKHLCDDFNLGILQRIDVLRFNSAYNLESLVDDTIQKFTLNDLSSLSSKIGQIVYEPLSEEAMFEVHVSLRSAYMDWNTVRAVWNINCDLRDDELEKRWIIDRDFLDALIEAYVHAVRQNELVPGDSSWHP